MKFRSFAILAVALTAAVALPALPATAATGPAAAQTTDTAAVAATQTYQGLNARINAKDGVGLVFEGSDWHADHVTAPSDIPNGGGTNFVLAQDQSHWSTEYGAYGTAKARIYDHGKPTDFWITMYASVYYYPYTKASCTIFRGDPDVTGKEIDFSPYTCAVTSIDHSDPWRVVFSVGHTAAEKVTDKDTQARLLNDACKGDDAVDNCFYTPTSVEYITDDPRPYGDPVANPYDSKMSMDVTSKHTVEASNSVGVKFTSELTLWKIWSNSLSISYQHTWTDSRTFSQSVDVDVPPHTEYWFTIAASLNRVTGDFLVRANGKVYRIENATVVLPDAQKSATIRGNKAPFAGTMPLQGGAK